MFLLNLGNAVPGYKMSQHNAEVQLRQTLFKLYCVLYRRMRWAGHVACMEDRRVTCRMLVDRPEGKGLGTIYKT
jgi:hypothetical protein